jgi:transposase
MLKGGDKLRGEGRGGMKMLTYSPEKAIYLSCGSMDMRKSIDGLSQEVLKGFKLTPTIEAMFIFCNASRNRLKILEWDGDGFWVHYKRLERGRYPWPEENGEEKTMSLSHKELECLFEGGKLKLRFERIDYSGRPVA